MWVSTKMPRQVPDCLLAAATAVTAAIGKHWQQQYSAMALTSKQTSICQRGQCSMACQRALT